MTIGASAEVPLSGWALAGEWEAASSGGHVAGGQVCPAVQVLAVVTGVTGLAQHRWTHLQERCQIGAVRRVAVGAIVDYGGVLPEEGAALLRVTDVAGLIDRALHQETGTGRAVRVMAIGTRHFAFENRVPGEATDLCLLGLVATEADGSLRKLIEHSLCGRVSFVAIITGKTANLVRAARPVRAGQNTRLMTTQAGGIPGFGR